MGNIQQGGGGRVFVGKMWRQGQEWREGAQVGNCQAFFLGCSVEEKGRSYLLKFLERTSTFPAGSEKSSMWKVKTAAPRKHCKVGNLTLGTKPAQ